MICAAWLGLRPAGLYGSTGIAGAVGVVGAGGAGAGAAGTALLKTAVRMAAAGVRSLMVWSFRGLTAGLHSPVA